MKNAIIINHNNEELTKHSPLPALFNVPHENIISYKEFTSSENKQQLLDKINQIDYIILSGGESFGAHEEHLKEEVNFLRSTDKPIIAICFGHQLIARVVLSPDEFNKTYFKLGEKNLSSHRYRNGPLKLRYSHSYYIAPSEMIKEMGFDISDILTVNHKDFIAVMQHKDKPIFSMQGHPEYIDPLSPETPKKVLDDIMRYFSAITNDKGWEDHLEKDLIPVLEERINMNSKITNDDRDALAYSVSPRIKADGNYEVSGRQQNKVLAYYYLTKDGELWVKLGKNYLPTKRFKIEGIGNNNSLETRRSIRSSANDRNHEMNVEYYLNDPDNFDKFKSIALCDDFAFFLTMNGNVKWCRNTASEKSLHLIDHFCCEKTNAIFVLDDKLYFISDNQIHRADIHYDDTGNVISLSSTE